jgi:hypothetical protein
MDDSRRQPLSQTPSLTAASFLYAHAVASAAARAASVTPRQPGAISSAINNAWTSIQFQHQQQQQLRRGHTTTSGGSTNRMYDDHDTKLRGYSDRPPNFGDNNDIFTANGNGNVPIDDSEAIRQLRLRLGLGPSSNSTNQRTVVIGGAGHPASSISATNIPSKSHIPTPSSIPSLDTLSYQQQSSSTRPSAAQGRTGRSNSATNTRSSSTTISTSTPLHDNEIPMARPRVIDLMAELDTKPSPSSRSRSSIISPSSSSGGGEGGSGMPISVPQSMSHMSPSIPLSAFTSTLSSSSYRTSSGGGRIVTNAAIPARTPPTSTTTTTTTIHSTPFVVPQPPRPMASWSSADHRNFHASSSIVQTPATQRTPTSGSGNRNGGHVEDPTSSSSSSSSPSYDLASELSLKPSSTSAAPTTTWQRTARSHPSATPIDPPIATGGSSVGVVTAAVVVPTRRIPVPPSTALTPTGAGATTPRTLLSPASSSVAAVVELDRLFRQRAANRKAKS